MAKYSRTVDPYSDSSSSNEFTSIYANAMKELGSLFGANTPPRKPAGQPEKRTPTPDRDLTSTKIWAARTIENAWDWIKDTTYAVPALGKAIHGDVDKFSTSLVDAITPDDWPKWLTGIDDDSVREAAQREYFLDNVVKGGLKDLQKLSSDVGTAVLPEYLEPRGMKIDDERTYSPITQDVKDSMVHTFGPFVPGGTPWKEGLYRFQDRPLDTLVNFSIVNSARRGVTTNAAKAIVENADEASKISRGAQKTLGLEPSATNTIEDAVPATRSVTGKGGTLFVPAKQEIKDKYGNTYEGAAYDVAADPVRRARQAATETAYRYLPAVSPISKMRPEVRGPRKAEKRAADIKRRELDVIKEKLANPLKPLTPEQRAALVDIGEGFNTVERINQNIMHRMARVKNKAAAVGLSGLSRKEKKALKREGIEAPDKGNMSPAKARKLIKEAADIYDLIDEIEQLRRTREIVRQGITPEMFEAVRALKATDEIVQQKMVEAYMRTGGMTRKKAEELVRLRRNAPLAAVGIFLKKGSGEKPMIFSHVTRNNAANLTSRDAFRFGISDRRFDDMKKNSLINFLNSRRTKDPMIMIDSMENRMIAEAIHERNMRAIASAEKFDADKHFDRLKTPSNPDGDLVFLVPDDEMVQLMDRVRQKVDGLDLEDAGLIPEGSEAKIQLAAQSEMVKMINKVDDGLVIPDLARKQLIRQNRDGISLLDWLEKSTLYTRSMSAWRHVVLTLKGTFWAFNFIGNSLLGAFAHGPLFFASLAKQTMPRSLRSDASNKMWDATPDIKRAGATESQRLTGAGGRTGDQGLLKRTGSKLSQDGKRYVLHNITQMLGDKVGKSLVHFTEDNFRMAAFERNLEKKITDLQRANNRMVKAGAPGARKLSDDEIATMVFNNKDAVENLARKTYEDMLDYSRLTDTERGMLLPFYPFWNFTRSITGKSIDMVLDEGWKIEVARQIGDKGWNIQDPDEQVGAAVPDWLKAAFIWENGGDTFASKISAMPVAATADLMTQLYNLVSSSEEDIGHEAQSIVSQMGPLPKFFLQGITGYDAFRGKKMEGTTKDHLVETAKQSLPPWSYWDKYKNPSPYTPFKRDGQDYLEEYFLGKPWVQLDPENLEMTGLFAIQAYDKEMKRKYWSAVSRAQGDEEKLQEAADELARQMEILEEMVARAERAKAAKDEREE